MAFTGLRYDPGSLEEGLARRAFERESEIEFLKLVTVCNAIMSVGNQMTAAVSKSEAPGNDAFKKSVDAVQKMLVPHWAEDTDRKAKKARETLIKEVGRGPLKIKVLGKDRKTKRRR